MDPTKMPMSSSDSTYGHDQKYPYASDHGVDSFMNEPANPYDRPSSRENLVSSAAPPGTSGREPTVPNMGGKNGGGYRGMAY
jgi:hypothetical protein